MFIIRTAFLSVLLTLTVSTSAFAQAKEQITTKMHHESVAESLFIGLEHDAAKTVIAFHAALASGDEKQARALLADDVLIFEGGGVERSADQYADHHLKSDIAYLKTMTITPLEHQVKVIGNTAISTIRKNNKGTRKGKTIDKNTMETMVLNIVNGQWRIVHIHWSST